MTECCIPHASAHLPGDDWAALQPGDEVEVTVFAGKVATFAIIGVGGWLGARPSLQLRPISAEPAGTHVLTRAECGRLSYWWDTPREGYGGPVDSFRRLSGQLSLELATTHGGQE